MKPDETKARELSERAQVAAATGLHATAALLYRRAAWYTPADNPARKARFELSKSLSKPKAHT